MGSKQIWIEECLQMGPFGAIWALSYKITLRMLLLHIVYIFKSALGTGNAPFFFSFHGGVFWIIVYKHLYLSLALSSPLAEDRYDD